MKVNQLFWSLFSPGLYTTEGCDLAICLVPFSQKPEVHHLIVTEAKVAQTFTSLISSSLFVSMRSSRQPLLVGSLIPFVRGLPSIHVRNLRDCMCPAVLALQQTLGWLKSSMRTRSCQCETPYSYLKKASTTPSS